MRKRIGWWGLIAAFLMAPATGLAQNEVPPTDIPPGFLSHPHLEEGGLYVDMGFPYWLENRTIGAQTVAVRGFRDIDGSITGTPGTFVGSGAQALNTNELQGPGTFQPGWDLSVGWKFQGGGSIEINWLHLVQAQYSASASLLAPGFNVGPQLQNTFLYAPVANFTPQWAGATQEVSQGNPGATYGIWNAASAMQIYFTQRFDIYQIVGRIPIWQTDSYRGYGLFGPRIAWAWEEFKWRTVSADTTGDASASTTAIYDNSVSNRMYGFHFGYGNDWYLGTNMLGAIAFNLEAEGSGYFDYVKTDAGYVRADNQISSTRATRMYSLVPGLELRAGFTWYPYEGIQVKASYNLMTFFNTIASPNPVDFNLGSVDPQYQNILLRWYQGVTFGVTFIF